MSKGTKQLRAGKLLSLAEWWEALAKEHKSFGGDHGYVKAEVWERVARELRETIEGKPGE